MNTRKLRKIILTLCSALLLVSLSVGLTVAYLSDTTEVVTNTFTTGKVIIDLDEAKVNPLGKPMNGDEVVEEVKDAERTRENTYKLYPNHEYVKDPTIYVGTAKGGEASEDCWLFVKVVNEIADIEAAKTIATQMADNGWSVVEDEEGVYAYKEIVKNGAKVPVFESFKIKSDVDNDTLDDYENKKVTVMAYAVQADGFDTAAEAWADAPCTWGEDDTTTEEGTNPDTPEADA